jgi:hypothetical protein
MRIIKSEPAAGKPRKIICTGCGKRAVEAGLAVPDHAVEEAYSPDGPTVHAVVGEDEMEPLCDGCVTALLRDRPNFSRV